MLPWCGPMDLAGWLIIAATWSAIVGLAAWAVLLLFPVRRSSRPRREPNGPRATEAPSTAVSWPAPPPEA